MVQHIQRSLVICILCVSTLIYDRRTEGGEGFKKVVALGRSAFLGSLYDEPTEEFIHVSIFKKNPPEKFVTKVDSPSTESKYGLANSYSERTKLLKITAEVAVSAVSGILKARATIGFLNARASSYKSLVGGFVYKMRTVDDFLELFYVDVLPYINMDVLYATSASHIVIGLGWGATVAVKFEDNNDHGDSKDTFGAYLELSMNYLLTIDFKIGLNASLGKAHTTSGFHFDFFGDVSFEGVHYPRTIAQLQQLIQAIPKMVHHSNEGKGSIQYMYLVDIQRLKDFITYHANLSAAASNATNTSTVATTMLPQERHRETADAYRTQGHTTNSTLYDAGSSEAFASKSKLKTSHRVNLSQFVYEPSNKKLTSAQNVSNYVKSQQQQPVRVNSQRQSRRKLKTASATNGGPSRSKTQRTNESISNLIKSELPISRHKNRKNKDHSLVSKKAKSPLTFDSNRRRPMHHRTHKTEAVAFKPKGSSRRRSNKKKAPVRSFLKRFPRRFKRHEPVDASATSKNGSISNLNKRQTDKPCPNLIMAMKASGQIISDSLILSTPLAPFNFSTWSISPNSTASANHKPSTPPHPTSKAPTPRYTVTPNPDSNETLIQKFELVYIVETKLNDLAVLVSDNHEYLTNEEIRRVKLLVAAFNNATNMAKSELRNSIIDSRRRPERRIGARSPMEVFKEYEQNDDGLFRTELAIDNDFRDTRLKVELVHFVLGQKAKWMGRQDSLEILLVDVYKVTTQKEICIIRFRRFILEDTVPFIRTIVKNVEADAVPIVVDCDFDHELCGSPMSLEMECQLVFKPGEILPTVPYDLSYPLNTTENGTLWNSTEIIETSTLQT